MLLATVGNLMEAIQKIPHKTAYTYIGLTIVIVIVGLLRYFGWFAFTSAQGLSVIPICAVLIIGIFFVWTVVTVIGVAAIAITRNILPAVFLIVGIYLVFQMPLTNAPLPERPPTPELKHFLEHRADYEQAIRLIKEKSLTPCYPEYSDRWFYPPRGYEHTSRESCLVIWTDQKRGLFVEFYPLKSLTRYILYVENHEYKVINPCEGGYLLQEIKPHWYVCDAELWN